MAGAVPVHNRAATLQSSKPSGTSFAKATQRVEPVRRREFGPL